MWVLRYMWDLPGPEIESMSPVLASRLFTTESRRKPPGQLLNRGVQLGERGWSAADREVAQGRGVSRRKEQCQGLQ